MKSMMDKRRAKVAGEASLKVVLVEDQPEVREYWQRLIRSFRDITCLGACTSAEEALRVIPEWRPDVVLMDIFLPRMSGIECTAQLKELLPGVQIVILTAVEDDELIFLALEAGADGYLLKQESPANLRMALLDVRNGGAPMTSEIARRVIQSFRRPARNRGADVRLTTREEEILMMLGRGYANKEIADRLKLSVDTVRAHLKHIYEKLHVRSRTEAVVRYLARKPNSTSDDVAAAIE